MNIFKWFKGRKNTDEQINIQTEGREMEGNPYVKAKLQLLQHELERKNLAEKDTTSCSK